MQSNNKTRTIQTGNYNVKFLDFEVAARRDSGFYHSFHCIVTCAKCGAEVARIAEGITRGHVLTFAQVCDVTRARAIVASI